MRQYTSEESKSLKSSVLDSVEKFCREVRSLFSCDIVWLVYLLIAESFSITCGCLIYDIYRLYREPVLEQNVIIICRQYSVVCVRALMPLYSASTMITST